MQPRDGLSELGGRGGALLKPFQPSWDGQTGLSRAVLGQANVVIGPGQAGPLVKPTHLGQPSWAGSMGLS